MKITETQKSKVSKVVVKKDDPGAVRVIYTGTEPGEGGLDTRHPDYKPSGELMRGDAGYAKPIHPEHEGFMWYFTSDSGFSMVVPPHDLS